MGAPGGAKREARPNISSTGYMVFYILLATVLATVLSTYFILATFLFYFTYIMLSS
jgi:hypothetical protein